MINTLKAIQALYPNVTRAIDDGFPNVKAFDASGNEVTLNLDSIQSWVDPDAYKFARAREYPSIGDQLDALWKGGNAAAEMLAKVQAVKAKYPKGVA